ncbi:MAG: Eco57I restriction-modification methylase domain-containing protein, partial [Candidatus Helarchaeota archaeon]
FITLISNFDRGKKIWMRLRKNFQVKDCLNENLRELKVDLIIGNPPWITYKELSLKMQKKILELARFEKINPDSKNVANVEISTVFFYRTSELFLKKNGKIMFLTTRSLMNGSHAARFRKFNGFSTVILYQIMDQVFNTNTIAWFAIKNDDVYFSKHDKILSKIITNQKIQEEIYLYPLYNKEDEVGKLIPMNEKLIINEIKISPYAKSCFRGFSAFPRIFYFVKKEERENKIILRVDEDILKRSKGIWKEKSTYLIKKLNDFYNLNSENLRKYLFPILLSRGFEAFRVNEYFTMVLPITRDKSSGEFRFIDEEHEIKEIHLYHQLIDSFWKEAESSKKKQLNTIFKRLNYQGDLLKKEMFRPIKVVYNEAGSRLKSVVINDGVLIDITCYYIATSSLDEAHYLCSIFNSNTINESLSILKSDRHFHKRPVSELAIPKFDESNKIHQELVLLSKKCHALEQKKSINDEILKIDKLISSDFF